MKIIFILTTIVVFLATGMVFGDAAPDPIKVSSNAEITALHNKILYPTARVRTASGVGSGVIFTSVKEGEFTRTYVLTNWHVIESAISIKEEWNPLKQKMEPKETRATIEVEIFKYLNMSIATGTLLVQADLVEWNKDQDLALLKLRTDEILPTADLYKGRKEDLRIFTSIYVCGAGNGRSPFPTNGQIASLNDEIDSIEYWMINAPTVFGNSGGGVFLAKEKQFIGIPSRLAITFVGWSPNAVYHMGYIIPITRILKWLEDTGWGFLVDPTALPRDKWLEQKKKERKN